jgi:cation:H+ antiporter
MGDVLILLAGVAVAALGGEFFVRGAVGLAVGLRVPAGIIGVTVAAFATSSPELSVGVNAARDGRPELALGDALGSNVVNLGIVLGVALLVRPLRAETSGLRRDLPVALAAPVLTAVLLADGLLNRADGVALLVVFAAWLGVVVSQARTARADAIVEDAPARRRALLEVGAGLAMLVVAGRLIVVAAKGIGASLGIDEFLVGATLVAVATSAPELATALLARRKGHDDIGLGTILGSNVFNNLWIVGIAALIRPIEVAGREVAVAVAVGVVLVLLAIPLRSSLLGRQRGAALVTLYAGYVVVLLVTAPR